MVHFSTTLAAWLLGVSGARGVSPGPAGAPPTHALLRTTIEIAPVSSRSCAAACVFESPVCPLIDSTISSTSSPAAAAAPLGSSAATIGCTTSPARHQLRSNPSSSRTNRMPRRT